MDFNVALSAVELFSVGIIVIACVNLLGVLIGWRVGITANDPGMAVSTAVCFIGIAVCLLVIVKVKRKGGIK